VAVADDGSFVVAWENGQDAWFRRFTAAGAPAGAEARANTTTADAQTGPRVAADAAGNFIVTWTSNNQDGQGLGVYARRFAADGTPRGGEFQVNIAWQSDQKDARVAADADGDFVVVYRSGPVSEINLLAQRFDSAGQRVGEPLRSNLQGSSAEFPEVAMNASGEFVVVFDGNAIGNGAVDAKRYDAQGRPQGPTFGALPQGSYNGAVALADDGTFLVSGNLEDVGGQSGVTAQLFNGSGLKAGQAFFLNTTRPDSQYDPSVATQPGGFMVTWTSNNQDGSGGGVYAQHLLTNNPPAVTEASFDVRSGRQKMVYRFSEDVSASLSADDLIVAAVPGGAAFAPSGYAYDPATNTATFTFADLPNGNYRATLAAAGVSDAAGATLVSNNVLNFFILIGDINSDRAVNGTDFAILAGNFGKSGMIYAQGDLNGDRFVNGSDFALLAGNFGKTVPPPAAAVSPPTAAVTTTPANAAPTRSAPPAPVARRTAPLSPPAAPVRRVVRHAARRGR
jgi:hypothetical protein